MAKKLTQNKAKEILHDKSVHGHPLTDKQCKFFGAIAGGAKPYEQAQIGTSVRPISLQNVQDFFEMLSVPQKAATKVVTGKYQTPSEAMGIKNEAGAMVTDILLDPMNILSGAGLLKARGVFKNANKLNPLALKVKPKKKEEGGWLDKYVPKAQNGIEGTMGGLTDKGFNYNGAWGGTMQDGGNLMPAMAGANQTVPMFQMGGNLPGATGMMYARVGAPSNGPYAKKTKASAQNGMEMKYYQEGLDFKPKTISKDGGLFEIAQGGINAPSSSELLRMVRAQQNVRGDIASLPGATIQVPLSEEQLKKNKEQKELNRLAQEAIAKQPSIGSPSARQMSKEQVKAKNIQYAKSTGKKYDEETGKVSPRFSEQQEKTLGKIEENILEPMLALETGFAAAPLVKGALKNVLRNIPQASIKASQASPELSPSILQSAINRLTGKNKVVPLSSEYSKKILNLPADWTAADVDTAFKKTADWVTSDEYIARRMANTGETRKQIEKSTARWMSDFKKRGTVDFDPSTFRKDLLGYFKTTDERAGFLGELFPTFREPEIGLLKGRSKEEMLETLGHETLHAYSPTLRKEKLYKNYPFLEVETLPKPTLYEEWFKTPKTLTEAEKTIQYYSDPAEQQVRAIRLYDKIREDLGLKGYPKVTEEQFKNWMENYYNPNISELNRKGFDDVGELLTRASDYQTQKGVGKEQFRKNVLDWMNKAWAVPAVGAGLTGVAGMEQKQDGGDIPVDPEGYWNPENWGRPVIIPSNIITMEGVDQPLIGISDTGDVQYMEPGEDYEFDGDYVTEYPVAKEGISVNNADAQPNKKLDQLLNFTNYNKPTKGGWLDKYQ